MNIATNFQHIFGCQHYAKPIVMGSHHESLETSICSCYFLCLDAKKVTKEKSRLQKNELKFTAFRDNEDAPVSSKIFISQEYPGQGTNLCAFVVYRAPQQIS